MHALWNMILAQCIAHPYLAGLVSGPVVLAIVAKAPSWLLSGTAKITPAIAKFVTGLMIMVLAHPMFKSFIISNGPAIKGLVDTAVSCVTAVLQVIDSAIDDSIDGASNVAKAAISSIK